MKSIWLKESKLPDFPELNEDIKTDVLIIGGGMAGILCAYTLGTHGVDCVIAEADKICGGITGNTTAKISCQHGAIYHKLIKEFGCEMAKKYFEANLAAVNKYAEICKNLSCDFERKNSFVYSLDNPAKIEKEAETLNRIGYRANSLKSIGLPFTTAGAVEVKNQAQFNPVKFVSEIAKNLKIYENTPVTQIEEDVAFTNKCKIKAKKIIVATHFPFLNKHGSYFLKLYQHRSYVIAYKNAGSVAGMYVDENKKGISLRSYNDLLLIGGGAHRTGKNGGCWQAVEDFAKEYYPESAEVTRWATQDCMTLDGVPYIGNYSKNTPDLYVATGFNKWGMTSSMVSATLLTDMILGKENDYADIFSPSRTIMRPQLAINGVEATLNLLTPSRKRCPHLGCALKWNKVEHTWDCPCHGSRFSKDGKLIDNPATGDIGV